jgi:hypothetical protein
LQLSPGSDCLAPTVEAWKRHGQVDELDQLAPADRASEILTWLAETLPVQLPFL